MKNFGVIFFGLIVLINEAHGANQLFAVSEVYRIDNCTELTGFNAYLIDSCFYDGIIEYYTYWTCNSTAVQVTQCEDGECTLFCQFSNQISYDTCISNTNSIVGDYEKLLGCWEDDRPKAFPSKVWLEYSFYDNEKCEGDPYSYSYINGTCYFDPLFGVYFKYDCGSDGVPTVYDCGLSSNCSSCIKPDNQPEDICYSFSSTNGFYLRCGPTSDTAFIEFNKVIILMAILMGILY